MATQCNESTEYGIVGYTGHIPGLRDQLGQSFGFASIRLVVPCDAPDSEHPLADDPSADKDAKPTWSPSGSLRDDRPHWITHLSSLDLSNYPLNPLKARISGYAGHTPTDALFGARYHRQLSGTVSEQRSDCGSSLTPNISSTQRLRMAASASSDIPDATSSSPPCSCGSVAPSDGCNTPPPKQFMSVFDLPKNDPTKYTPRGYTGYLPSISEEFGVSFQEASRRAMDRLGTRFAQDRMLRVPDSCQKGVKMTCPWLNEQTSIYPVKTGLMPNYTGHLPGYRWVYGTTFGRATKDLKAQLASF